MHPWDIEELLDPIEDPLAHQHHGAVLILGVYVDVNAYHHQNSTKNIVIEYFLDNKGIEVPINVVDGEGFGEEDEGENNTDGFSECGHSDCQKGSKLPYQAEHNLKKMSFI